MGEVCCAPQMAFRNRPVEDVLREIADAGADAIELALTDDVDVDAVATTADAVGVSVNAVAGPGAVSPLERPALTYREDHDELVAGLRQLLEKSRPLDCRTVMLNAGPTRERLGDRETHDVVTTGLDRLTGVADEFDATLLVEPLNSQEFERSFVTSASEMAELLESIDSDRIELLFDAYHQYLETSEVRESLRASVGHVGDVHLAGVPDRCRLSDSDVDFEAVMTTLRTEGYEGPVCLEFCPADPTAAVREGVSAIRRNR